MSPLSVLKWTLSNPTHLDPECFTQDSVRLQHPEGVHPAPGSEAEGRRQEEEEEELHHAQEGEAHQAAGPPARPQVLQHRGQRQGKTTWK